MTILDRYLFRSVLVTSMGAVGVFAFVIVVVNVAKELLGPVASGRLSVATAGELLFWLTASVVSFALPMGILTGILLVLGRMSSQQEITAMRAAGWGIARIARPIFVVALLGTAATLYFNLDLGPRAKSVYRTALADAVRTHPLNYVVSREFVTLPGKPKTILYVGANSGDRIEDVWCWRLDELDRVVYSAHATEGTVRFDDASESLKFELPQGTIEYRREKSPEDFSAGDDTTSIPLVKGRIPLAISLESLFGAPTTQRKISLKTFRELQADLGQLRTVPGALSADEIFQREVRIKFAMHKGVSTALAVLAFAGVAVPLGIKMQRRESSANLGLALLLSMTFYLAMIFIDLLQKQPELRPDLLLWLPNVVFGGLGLWLFRRVDRQ